MICDNSTDTDKCEQPNEEDFDEVLSDSVDACEPVHERIQVQQIEKCVDEVAPLDLIFISDTDDEIVVISSDEESVISVGDYADIVSISTDSTMSSESSSSPSTSDDSLPKVYFLKDQSFPCSQCGQSFPSQEQATAHIKSHSILRDEPFCCQYCGKSFKTKVYLQQHTRVHTRPFPCQYCNKSFSTMVKYKSLISAIFAVHLFSKKVTSENTLNAITPVKTLTDVSIAVNHSSIMTCYYDM